MKEFDRSKSDNCLKNEDGGETSPSKHEDDDAPPIPPLPLHYQRSDGEFEWGSIIQLFEERV